jgi:hypothetical protein
MATHKIVYLYRDAGNYKFRGEFCVAGSLSLTDLSPYLLDEQYFVPDKIGIPSLVPQFRNGEDHDLHEIEEVVHIEPTACLFTSDEFISRVRAANIRGWF